MLMLFPCLLNAQTVDSLYEIATWKGFTQSAVSYTWDDNTPKQLSDALPLFDKFDFKVTFFIITSLNPNWNGLKQARKGGHEIASHTVTHTALNTLSDADQEVELNNSQKEINTQMGNTECITLAYPFCIASNPGITSSHYISARGCNGQIEQKTPSDLLNIASIICGAQGAVKTTQEFNQTVNNSANINGWSVFLLHGINNDGGFSSTDSAELSKHLEYMNNNRDKFWIATCGNVVRYIRERNAASVHELSNTDSLITFSVKHPLDSLIYNFPLTVKRTVPANWGPFTVHQNGKELPVRVVTKNSKHYFIIDVVPNSGNVLIKQSATTGISFLTMVSSFTVFPNPFALAATIRFELNHQAQIKIELLDENGKKVKTIQTGLYDSGAHEVLLNGSDLRGKLFYCALSINGQQLIRKIACTK